MGLEFSHPSTLFLPSPPSTTTTTTTRRSSSKRHNPPPTPPPTSSTQANTLANRSSTPVARHVALARLAERLSAMAQSRRERVIRQLHISPDVLNEVRKYTPSNSFSSIDQHESDSDSADGWQRPVLKRALGSSNGGKRERRAKGVSFAKYAEMRLFRE